jgi:FkbH-like protein
MMENSRIINSIKLVIWDLDETFWQGTLSEGGIQVISENIEIIKSLTDRGIMNSIASKNDFQTVQDQLVSLGIWEYFCFPKISWLPKGNLIKEIVENFQLRPENVLFIDDNKHNLREAVFYNDKLNVKDPSFISEILNHSSFKGKNDFEHTRLKQYKILEEKHKHKHLYSSNADFLLSSNIKVVFDKNTLQNLKRIEELIERTNQLNYTKYRASSLEILSDLNNPEFDSCLVRVSDNYGDYGIVGFYSLNKKTNKLKYFVFSCRILNLGIPQFVYANLNFPLISIIPEVAEVLDQSKPNWIRIVNENSKVTSFDNYRENPTSKRKIFFKGGCDLSQMLFYLENESFEIIQETNYVNSDNFPIHNEHSYALLGSILYPKEIKSYLENANYIPFIDSNFFKTGVFDNNYDCLVYSVLMDYTQELYISKSDKSVILPYGGYYNHLTDINNHENIISSYLSKQIKGVNANTLHEFSEKFDHVGKITPEQFINNLKKIRQLVPAKIPIIFLNGAEVNSNVNEFEEESYDRHVEMNMILEEYVKEHENIFLLDIRNIIKDKSQITDSIRHYNRESYKYISVDLLKLLNQVVDKKIVYKLSFLMKLYHLFPILLRIKKKLKRIFNGN